MPVTTRSQNKQEHLQSHVGSHVQEVDSLHWTRSCARRSSINRGTEREEVFPAQSAIPQTRPEPIREDFLTLSKRTLKQKILQKQQQFTLQAATLNQHVVNRVMSSLQDELDEIASVCSLDGRARRRNRQARKQGAVQSPDGISSSMSLKTDGNVVNADKSCRLSTVPEEDNELTCRICFMGLSDDPNHNLYRPCLCLAPVHKECLEEWRSTSSAALSTCPTCQSRYRLRRHSIFEWSWRLILFAVAVAFLAIVVALIGSAFCRGHCVLAAVWPNRGKVWYQFSSMLYTVIGSEQMSWSPSVNSPVKAVENKILESGQLDLSMLTPYLSLSGWMDMLTSVSLATSSMNMDLALCQSGFVTSLWTGFHLLGAVVFWFPLIQWSLIAIGNKFLFTRQPYTQITFDHTQEMYYKLFLAHYFYFLRILIALMSFRALYDVVKWLWSKIQGKDDDFDAAWHQMQDDIQRLGSTMAVEILISSCLNTWFFQAACLVELFHLLLSDWSTNDTCLKTWNDIEYVDASISLSTTSCSDNINSDKSK